jgi:putative transposase
MLLPFFVCFRLPRASARFFISRGRRRGKGENRKTRRRRGFRTRGKVTFSLKCYFTAGVSRVYRAYKYRIYPSNAQKILIDKTFGCVRFIYNKLLAERQAWYERQKDASSDAGEKFYPLLSNYKKDCPWLKEVDSLALANAQLHLEKAYENFFKNKTFGFPRFKSKKHSRQSYTTNNQKGSVRIIDEKTLRLPKLKDVKIKLHRTLPPASLIKGATVSKSASGKYYAAILFAVEEQEDAADNLSEQILPLLKKNPLSENRREKKRLQRLRNSLTRGKRGGKNSAKKRRKIILLQEKAANRKKDCLHKLSRRIANALREQKPLRPISSPAFPHKQNTRSKTLRNLPDQPSG